MFVLLHGGWLGTQVATALSRGVLGEPWGVLQGPGVWEKERKSPCKSGCGCEMHWVFFFFSFSSLTSTRNRCLSRLTNWKHLKQLSRLKYNK